MSKKRKLTQLKAHMYTFIDFVYNLQEEIEKEPAEQDEGWIEAIVKQLKTSLEIIEKEIGNK